MLKDYRRYLLNVRNNLIQCGVELSVSSCETYEELFSLEQTLSQVLWYYSVLAISGSENSLKGFMFPLNSYYKEKMRALFYKEFLTFSKGYEQLSMSYALKRKGIEGEKPKVEEIIETERTEDIPEEFEIFEKPKEYVSTGVFLDDEELVDTVQEESHGVFLDDEEETERSHGVFLDEDTEDDSIEWEVEEEDEGPIYDDEGLDFLDDEDGIEWEDEEGDIEYEEELEDDEIEWEEDLEDDSIEWEEELEDDGVEWEEEDDSIVYEEEDEDDGIEWESEDEDFDDLEYEEDVEEEYENSEEGIDSEIAAFKGNSISEGETTESKPDLSDVLQGLTNNFLTKGSRAIRKEVKKFKKD